MNGIRRPQARRRGERGVRGALLVFGLMFVSDAAASQQQRVPVRDLGPTVAATTRPFVFFYGLWQFDNGSVLINDVRARKLLLFDSTLTSATIVGDSIAGAAVLYGRSATMLIPFNGDSVLYPDFPSSSLLVIGPDGKVARVMAAPKPSDLSRINGAGSGADAQGRLVYRTPVPSRPGPPGTRAVYPDSAAIVRGDFESRVVDTIGIIKTPTNGGYSIKAGADGKVSVLDTLVPVTWIDEWVVTSDGRVAILRGQDYHIDWIAPNGSQTSSPKLPFDWRRLTSDDKARIIDSAIAAYDARPQENRALTLNEASSFNLGGSRIDLGNAVRVKAIDGSLGVAMVATTIAADQIPDYNPPIRSGALKADRDGNLWILPNTSAQSRKGGLVYDIINREGELTERIEVPVGRSVAGFGKGGVVYLMSGDVAKGFTIERARFK
jgi:hypothetical protein